MPVTKELDPFVPVWESKSGINVGPTRGNGFTFQGMFSSLFVFGNLSSCSHASERKQIRKDSSPSHIEQGKDWVA